MNPPTSLTSSSRVAETAPSAETKEVILRVAERLFAEKGIDAASIRDITRAAEVNLGAINYHFGSKDGLIVAVFARRLRPLNEVRLARLDAVEKAYAPQQPPLEAVLEALIRPTVEYLVDEDPNSFMRLICRSFQEPNSGLAALLTEEFGEVVRRFNGSVQRAVPNLPADEVFWHITFMFGSLHHAVDTWIRFGTNPFASMPGTPQARRLNREELVCRLIHYTAAGMQAPRCLP